MAGADVTRPECFRIPTGVEFQRWQGDGEWVIYHAGTGETMRLSEAALAVLDLLAESDRLDKSAIEQGLHSMMDTPIVVQEMQAAVNELLRVLLNHECIERVSCD
jgi:hypothetical protein